MADEKKTYAAFTSVINSAITDFNSIYDAIKERSGADDTAMKTDTTGIATSEYAGLIKNKLFSISGITDGGTEKSIPTTITPYFESYAGNPVAVKLGEDGNVSITVGVPNKGYYGTEAKLTGSLAAENVALSGTVAGKANVTKVEATEGKGAYWHVAPTDGKVLGVVDVDVGSYAPSITEVTNGVSATASVGLSGTDGINGNVLTAVPEGGEAADYVSFKMKAAGSFTGKVTPVLGKTDFTAGYFEAAPTLEIAKTGYDIKGDATSTDQEFFIKKGVIDNVAVAGTNLGFTDEGSIGTSTAPGEAEAANYYKVTAGIAGGTITGNTTAGFVTDGKNTEIGTLEGISKDFYVKKGAVENSTVSVGLVADSTDVKVASTDADAYTVTVKRDIAESAETSGNYSDGYVKAGTYKVNTTVTEKVLKIARGTVDIKNTLGGITYAGTGADLLVKNEPAKLDDYYAITPTVALTSALNTTGSKEGYIVPSDTTVTHNEFDGTASSLYLKKGKITHTTDITINNTSTSAANIFTDAKPATGDYWTLTTKCNIATADGYVTAADVAKGDEKSYYLPKAVVEYVANSTGAKFVQVKSAGYLPTGTIEAIEGDIDYAAVSVNIGTATGENIIKTSGATGDYKLTIAKASTSNPGYITGADGEGSVDFAAEYYIAKGSVSSQASIDSVVKGDISRATGEGASGFKFDVTASGSAGTPTIAAGYITSKDVTVVKPTDKVVEMTLPEAKLAATLTGDAAHAGATLSTGLTAGDATSKYFVTPTLANATVKATVATAGYVDATSSSNEIAIEINDANRNVAYIKTGTTKKFTTTALDLSSKLSDDFDTTVSGDYTISLAGSDTFTGTLDTGYYGDVEKNIGIERSLTGSYTVAHGSVSVNTTAVTLGAASSSDVTVVAAPAKPADFAAITVPVASVAIAFDAVKPGYVKSGDVTNNTKATGSATVYIQKYENSEDKAADGSVPTASDAVNGGTTEKVYTPVPNGITDTTILHTEGRYLKHNVKVTLHADAIGTNAETDLEKLQKRLAGTLARA